MSLNLKIGFNNNFITNNTYTKFLGVTTNNTLFSNNRIDLFMRKWNRACCINRNAKTYMPALSLTVIYYAFFHSAMSYGIIFWGNSSHSSIFLIIYLWRLRMLLVIKKSSKLLWKNFYTLIHFTQWKITLANHELCTVLQDFYCSGTLI